MRNPTGAEPVRATAATLVLAAEGLPHTADIVEPWGALPWCCRSSVADPQEERSEACGKAPVSPPDGSWPSVRSGGSAGTRAEACAKYLARAQALAFGLSNAYFKSLGLPSLIEEC